MMKVKKAVFNLILSCLFSLGFLAAVFGEDSAEVIFFHSPSCQKCLKIKNELIPRIEEKYQGRVKIEYRNIDNIANYKFLLDLENQYGKEIEVDLPVVFLAGRFLTGEKEVRENLEVLLAQAQAGPKPKKPGAGKVDLIAYFLAFSPLAVAAAGLIDGFNPCAFTVIVFFISFLAFQGYRKREMIAIGLSFIFAVFLTYLALGLGLFGFLYKVKGFWGIIKIFNLSVGAFSFILGVICLYDLFKFWRSGNTQGQILQLPKAVKNQIHKLIGSRFRMHQEDQPQALKENFFGLVLGALACGFLVSLLEAVCTGQMYLPAIAFVLKTTSLKLPAVGYLVLYNIMFIIPLLLVFLFALLGVSSQQFAGFLKRHLGSVRLLMALLFFILGIFLLWKA